MRRIWIGCILPLIFFSTTFALNHPDPYSESEIQFSGWPHYLENITVGSPVSDYGSHYGIKLTATRDGMLVNALSARHLLNSAHYAAFTDFFGQLDQIYIYFEVENYGQIFSPAEFRTAEFSCWGWKENVLDGNFSASGWATTIDTDAFLLYAVVSAPQGAGRVKPYIILHMDRDGHDESTMPPSSWRYYEYELDPEEQLLKVAFKRLGSSLYRAIKPSFSIERAYFRNYETEIVIEGDWLQWGEDWKKTIYIVIGAGLTSNEATSTCKEGFWTVEDEGPKKIIDSVQTRWEQIFSNLPTPHISNDEENLERVYDIAACGLIMNLYSPRDAMTTWGSVPGKAHFNVFWGWDTAFQALGMSNFDIETSKENMVTLFSGPENRVYLELNDSLKPTWGPVLTQQPVQGRVIWDIFLRDGAKDVTWLESMYRGTKSYLSWWERERDTDADGLYEWALTLETGWDDSPRFGCQKSTNICLKDLRGFEPIDVNSYLYEYYLYAAKMASFLGYQADAKDFSYKAQILGGLIDSELYDYELGAYFDRSSTSENDHKLVKVFTPAIFWPLSVGLVKSPERAKRIVERYLLNPDYFWYGEKQLAIPTVAFNDPNFDFEQDGFYWQGQVWLVTNYMATLALWRYGYGAEAHLLAQKTLEMIASADPGGIYENYDPKTGAIGFGITGRFWDVAREPSVFQFGWSCAFAIELLLERYQRERYLMPEDTELSGYLSEVTYIATGKKFYWVETESYEVPKSHITSANEEPLTLDPQEITLKLSDEYGSYGLEDARVCFGLSEREVFEETIDGNRQKIQIEPSDEGLCFTAKVGKKYIMVRLKAAYEETAGACGCSFYPHTSLPSSRSGLALLTSILLISVGILISLSHSRFGKVLGIALLLLSLCLVSCQNEKSKKGEWDYNNKHYSFPPGIIDKLHCAPGEIVPEPTGPIFPEINTYPRLFFNKEDLEKLKERREQTPYSEFYSFIEATSNREPDPPDGEFSPTREYANSEIAAACAFRALLEGDEQIANKAKLILLNVPIGFGEPIDFELIDSDIRVAEAIEQFAVAFDILAGSEFLNESDFNEIFSHLELVVASVYSLYMEKLQIFRELWMNNHTTKIASALGVAALVLNQSQHAQKWFNYGLTKTYEVLDFQLTSEGVCAEGSHYYAYSAYNHLPFAIALHRLTDGRDGYYFARKCTVLGTDCHWECTFVPDLLTWDKMKASFLARVKLRMPDGNSPPTDDAFLYGFLNGLVSSLLNDETLAWDWVNTPASPYFHGWRSWVVIALYALFDVAQPQTPPDFGPTVFLPESGVAVFRNGWDINDTYLLFLAESGQARTSGLCHEHADGLSFSLFSHGELLALDCGYISYTHHELVRNGVDHNLVLVDGAGPESPHIWLCLGGVDAFLTDFWDTDFLDAAYGRTFFNGASHGRQILFFEQPTPFFIIADHLLSSQAHDYTWVLHGNGGGDSGGNFWLTSNGAVWQRQNAYLQAAISSTRGKPALSSKLEEHGLRWMEIKYHEALWASVYGQNAAFVALLLPASVETPYLNVEASSDTDKKAGWLISEIEGQKFFAFVQENYQEFTDQIAEINLATSARTLVFTISEPDPYRMIFVDGKDLTVDGAAYLSAPSEVTVGIKLTSEEAKGYVVPKEAQYIDIWVGFAPTDVSGQWVSSWEYLGNGVVRINLAFATEFKISKGD